MHIDDALERLKMGKFSFQMSDCIAAHVAEQTRQIEALTALNDRRGRDIMQGDLQIHLLEKEVTHLKTLLSGTIRLQALLSRALETATKSKEKLRSIDALAVKQWVDEIQGRFAAQGENLGRKGEQILKDMLPQAREILKSVEKFTGDIFSKIKAAT